MAASFRSILGKSIQPLIGMCVVLTMLGVTAKGQSGNTTLTDGQTPLGLEPGAPAGAYALSGLDNINLFNGNLNFRLPLIQIGGRGGAQMSMTLPIELKWRVFHLFTPEIPPNPPSHTYLPFPSVWNPIQPGYGPGVLIGRKAGTEADCGTVIPPHIRYTLTRLTFISPDGTEYELRDQLTQGKPADLGGSACSGGSNFVRGKVFVTADGSAMTFISDQPISDAVVYSEFYYPTGYLLLRDGTRFRIEQGLVKRITDRNGNWLNFTYDQYNEVTVITDSLNRTVNITYAETLDGFDQISWKGSQRSPRSIKVWRGLLSDHLRTDAAEGSSGYALKTLHELFPELPAQDDTTNFDWYVISKVELPDARQYRFYYNSYAELARVELPTGGAYEYDFTPTSGVLWVEAIHRRVVERRVYPNGLTLEGKTTYSDTDVGNHSEVDVNHKAPDETLRAREKHYFNSTAALSMSPAIEAVCYGAYLDGKEYLTESYNTGGNVLRKLEQSYAQRTSVPWWGTWQGPACLGEPPNDTRLTVATTTLTDVTPNLVAKRTFGYDQFNNVTDTCDYDFGSGAAGPLLRHARTTYVVGQFNNTNYTAFDLVNPGSSIHLRSLPLAQIVNTSCMDEETALAKTEYEYDNYTTEGGTNPNHAALAPRSNISGHDDAVFSAARLARGNATSVKRWIDSDNSVSTYEQYDIAGNVVKSKDALGKATSFDFADRFGMPDDDEAESNTVPSELNTDPQLSTYAIATKVTNALSQVAYIQYDYYLGKPVNSEDVNQVVASLYYETGANKLDRPVKLVSAANFSATRTQSQITYDDPGRTVTTSSDLTTFGDGLLTSAIIYDGLGRAVETRNFESGGHITTTQSYDAMGRASTVSNPFRDTSEDTYGTTVTGYDSLSRVARVETFDKNNVSTGAVTTDYLGNKVTVTDQTAKKRRSVTDGLGRLIRVDEPDAVTGNLDNGANPVQPTNYAYDALGNLTTVTQQLGATTQIRRFAYDKMSRLIFAANPEQNTSDHMLFTYNSQQWAVRYEYNPASNLKFKTDTRKPGDVFVKVTYDYDDLQRLTTRSYTDGTPTVTYNYDTATKGVGRLASVVTTNVSTTSYTVYDPLGRPLDYNQQTASQTYTMHRAYNRAGLMISETYPSLKVFQTEYDSAGRVAGVSREVNYYGGAQASDATNRIQYSPAGAMKKIKLGNGLWEHTDFNSRLQPKLIGLGASDTTSGTLQLEYDYGSTSNNGNVLSQKITAPTGTGSLLLTQSYTYDKLNRLLTANEKVNQESTPRWTQSCSFDRWGNRTGLTNTGELPPANQLAVNPATNRFSALLYDEAGNQPSDESSHPLTYDAENHQKSFTSGAITYNYSYDGDGRRVKREYNDGTLHTTVFVYNASGQLIAEYNSDPAPPVQGGGGVSYLTTDHLGSTRVVTNSTGGVKARHDYLPFGEDVGSGIGSRFTVVGYNLQDGVRQKFTQKERDNESGLDYFGERYYSSAQGRFTTCDPLGASMKPENPQTLNRFTFVLNNPLRYVDPDGLDASDSDYWSRLTEEEQRRFSRFFTRGQKFKNDADRVKAAGEKFNKLIQADQDGKPATEKQMAARFVTALNFHDKILTNPNISSEIREIAGFGSGGVEVVVWNRNEFLTTLANEGYGVNLKREVFSGHKNDSAREYTEKSRDPAMHFANDDPDRLDTFISHVDRQSTYCRRCTWLGIWEAAETHRKLGNMPPLQYREYLKRTSIAPQKP